MPVSVPTFIKQAWAAVGSKFTIPDNANPTTGRAGWDQGFSPINLTPVTAGGIPPFGQDMNGVLYDITSAIQYIQAGRSFPYNQDFADAIGGYGKGSLVSLDSDLSVVYKSKVDNNLTPPPSANWEVAGEVSQATETVAGVAKIATQAKVNTGTDDEDFVTPKKLRFGFSSNFSSNGYLFLPSWLGGLGIQCGAASAGPAPLTIPFPISFPTKVLIVVPQCQFNDTTSFAGGQVYVQTKTASNFSISLSSIGIIWIAFGH